MSTATSPTRAPLSNRRRPSRGRGRTATHDPEALLDLIAGVAHAAVAAGKAVSATKVSMPVFNRLKLDVDRARGIADPSGDPERTPTANAMLMRFKQVAGRTVKWEELLDGALRTGRQRTMWLSALRRDEKRDDLTDQLVIHALRLVAARRGVDTLTRRQYDETRDAMLEAERQRHGEAELLEYLLPTTNQILAHCELSWEKALKLARLQPPRQRQRGGHRRPHLNPAPGMPTAQVVAVYAALNGAWPSRPVLYDFATKCDIRMADPSGPMGPVRAEAARLLGAEGIPAPTRTRGGGKGKRLSYRYPTNGIPGAPLRDPVARRDQMRVNPRLADLRQERRVLSVRVWLAGLAAAASRSQSAYAAWTNGKPEWVATSTLIRHGGFEKHKQLAAAENARIRQAGGDPLADALAKAKEVAESEAAIYAGGTARTPPPVPVGEMLRAVLAGPHTEVEAPRQS